jgi:hypothetical protein
MERTLLIVVSAARSPAATPWLEFRISRIVTPPARVRPRAAGYGRRYAGRKKRNGQQAAHAARPASSPRIHSNRPVRAVRRLRHAARRAPRSMVAFETLLFSTPSPEFRIPNRSHGWSRLAAPTARRGVLHMHDRLAQAHVCSYRFGARTSVIGARSKMGGTAHVGPGLLLSPSLGPLCAQILLFFVHPKYARAVLRAGASNRCARCDAAPCGPQAGTTARGVL